MEGNNLEVNLNGLNFSDVIDGLNKYFAEDETRIRIPRSFIEIERPKVFYYRFDAEMYLDKLIAWLRTKHGIFYYPGMEAKYAKAEKYISDDLTISFMLDCIGSWLHSGATRDCIKMLAESGSKIENSDINKLIRDYCTKNDIRPPSPYFSDKACVEYLFSVVDLERGHRAAVGKQMVDDYKLSLKKYILTDIQESIYCCHGLETKSVEELITWLIKMARLPKTSEFESFLRDFKEL